MQLNNAYSRNVLRL